jgi:hypothetical protein
MILLADPETLQIEFARMNAADKVHRVTMRKVLHEALSGEARVHGASLKEESIEQILERAARDKIQIHFVIAGHEIAGCAIQFPTVLTAWNGKEFVHYPAIYGEDTYVNPELSSRYNKAARAFGPARPDGLGTRLVSEWIRHSMDGGNFRHGLPAKGLVAEFSRENGPVVGLLGKFNAKLERSEQNTVLELGADVLEDTPVEAPVDVRGLGAVAGEPLDNVFICLWKGPDGKSRMSASFTETFSTFTNMPVARVQFCAGDPMPGDDMRRAAAGLLKAGRQHIVKRRWAWSEFGTPICPLMRIHALNQPELAACLKELGARPRRLGSHTMRPFIIDYDRMPSRFRLDARRRLFPVRQFQVLPVGG